MANDPKTPIEDADEISPGFTEEGVVRYFAREDEECEIEETRAWIAWINETGISAQFTVEGFNRLARLAAYEKRKRAALEARARDDDPIHLGDFIEDGSEDKSIP